MDNCGCDNKKELYVCRDTPQGKDCIRVVKEPSCFKRSVTFYED